MGIAKFVKVLLASTCIVSLGGCWEDDTTPRLARTQEECMQMMDDAEACKKAGEIAKEQFAKTAPKFADKAECEKEFGMGACDQTVNQPGIGSGTGSNWFMPVMAGFMISRMMDNGANRYDVQPACNRRGDVYSNGCGSMSPRSGMIYPISSTTASSSTSPKVGAYSSGKFIAAKPIASAGGTVRGGFGAVGSFHTSASS